MYDRAKALSYARDYWTKVSSDGYVGQYASPYFRGVNKAGVFKRVPEADPYEVLHLPDGTTISGKDIDDCAHFVSCCIGKETSRPGGGLTIPRPFPDGPYGVLSANGLFEALKSADQISIVGNEKLSHATAAEKSSSLQKGDLIFYYDVDKGRYGHVGMFMGDSQKRIACHSYSRCDVSSEAQQEWDSVRVNSDPNKIKYTLCQVTG